MPNSVIAGSVQNVSCTCPLGSLLNDTGLTWHKEKTSEELEEHAFDKASKPHVCPTCGKGFSRSNILKDHQMKLHGETDLKRKPRSKCPIPECSSPPFHSLKDLEHHCEENHGDQRGMSNE